MSRSMRHVPVHGQTCAESDKWWKTHNHRCFRHWVKASLRAGLEPPLEKEASDVWESRKDGKVWRGWSDFRFGYKNWRGTWIRPYHDFGK